MNLDKTESFLLIIFLVLVIVALLTRRKKPAAGASKNAEEKIRKHKLLTQWTVYSMDIDGNCRSSAVVPVGTKADYVIGVAPEADFRILSKFVSRKHLILNATLLNMTARDNDSGHSTFHQGKKIDSVNIENKTVLWLADVPVIFMAPKWEYNEAVLAEILKNDIEAYGVPEIG